MSHVRRLYIDSRHRSSGTPSDFTHDLPGGGIEVPDHTIGLVVSVLRNTVFTAIRSRTHRLYLAEEVFPANLERTMLLQEDNYTGEQLAKHLNDSMDAHTSWATAYKGIVNEKTGQMTISNTDTHWSDPTRHGLISAGGIWTGNILDKNDLQDVYAAVGYTDSSHVLSGVLQHQGLVDLAPYKSLFLCSPYFRNVGQPVGPQGQGDTIRRIVITQGFGNRMFDAHATHTDYVDCSLAQLNHMHWRLMDEEGRTHDLKKTMGSPLRSDVWESRLLKTYLAIYINGACR